MDHKLILLKQASNNQELTNWENILIAKNKDFVINYRNQFVTQNFTYLNI
jgi:hypothetical protein